MRFVYKIYSDYDGFVPNQIPVRAAGNLLKLGGWKKYIDVIEKGWECWIYFHGRKTPTRGIYAVGSVREINYDENFVILRLKNYRTDRPIKSQDVCERIAKIVNHKGRQVFVLPVDFEKPWSCGEKSCNDKKCADCETFKRLPYVRGGDWQRPERLRKITRETSFVVAHWIKPRRCSFRNIGADIKLTSHRFYSFKAGEMAYAHPFALAMFKQLKAAQEKSFDCVIPIPLSPDKVAEGEKHRTKHVAKELGRLLKVRVVEMLELTGPISKRRMDTTPKKFEHCYEELLRVNKTSTPTNRILLVDDVITQGSTLAGAINKLQQHYPKSRIVAATAGQMIVKAAVRDESFISCAQNEREAQ